MVRATFEKIQIRINPPTLGLCDHHVLANSRCKDPLLARSQCRRLLSMANSSGLQPSAIVNVQDFFTGHRPSRYLSPPSSCSKSKQSFIYSNISNQFIQKLINTSSQKHILYRQPQPLTIL